MNQYFLLDFKMLFRCRRPRLLLVLSLVLLIMMSFYYFAPDQKEIYSFLVPLMTTGVFLFNIGSLNTALEGSFFPAILLNTPNLKQFIAGKYLALLTWTLLFSLLSFCFVISKSHFWMSILSCFAYHAGINSFVVFFISMYHHTRIDLYKQISDYSEFGPQFIAAIVAYAVPLGLFFTFWKLFGELTALYTITAIGLIGILLTPFFINILHKNLQNKKYFLSESFSHKK